MNPLMLATRFSSTPEIIKLLLKNGADVNATGLPALVGITPLMFAAMFSSPEVVKLLLDNGADVKFRTNKGATPLMFAVARPSAPPEIVTLLIEAGADVNARDDDGMTPLMVAEKRGSSSAKKEILKAAGAKE